MFEENINLKAKKYNKKKKINEIKNQKKIKIKRLLIINITLFLFFIIFNIIFFILKKKAKIKITKIDNQKITASNNTNNTNIENTNNPNNARPKIIAITYANGVFKRQLEVNKKSALEVGKVDEHYIFGPDDIDPDFKEKNKEILSKFRGNGLWLWKPYFIHKTFKEKLREGDYIIYTDAGILYMNSVYQVIDFLKEQNAEMWFNRLDLKEKLYSKRDAFILMGVDMPFYSETYQYMGGIQIYRKSKYTEKFIEQLLFYSQDKRIISDEPNKLGVENYKGFRENRHDQTVLSLLIKKYGEANSGNPTLTPDEINKGKHIIMPNIFCIYRRTDFKDYEDLKEKCVKIIERQEKVKMFTI